MGKYRSNCTVKGLVRALSFLMLFNTLILSLEQSDSTYFLYSPTPPKGGFLKEVNMDGDVDVNDVCDLDDSPDKKRGSSDNQMIWSTGPSQLLNTFSFIKYTLLCVALVYFTPTIYQALPEALSQYISWRLVGIICSVFVLRMFYLYLLVRMTKYILYKDVFIKKFGVFNQKISKIEMFRGEDVEVVKPIHLRLFGLGDVLFYSSDHTTPVERLHAIPKPEKFAFVLRTSINDSRLEHGVRKIE
jgi:hypothetical protein